MSFKVEIQPSKVTFSTENMLLDDAISQNVILEHSCKNGVCGACKAKLLKGLVENEHGQTVDSGEILTCCSIAKSDVVLEVEYHPELAQVKVQTIPCKLTEFHYATEDIIVLTLRYPPSVNFVFLPGQYVDLSFQGIVRSYSIASADGENKQIELHIRKVPEGKMSNLLFGSVSKEQLMRIEGPKGTFFVRENTKKLLFVATGTGISSVKSMVKNLVQQYDEREIYIYWGMRTEDEIYEVELKALSELHSNVFFCPLLSRDSVSDMRKGYVQNAVLEDFKTFEDVEVYACGSMKMIEDAKVKFLEKGLLLSAFHSDAYTPAK
ncbi:FAD-binding oxidoreductase [Shewanella sp.]|uniref:FAD-binding oxidoreductase n=1 Tax=Shewanella sp. TaxID=50422 RepID=UPI003A97935A